MGHSEDDRIRSKNRIWNAAEAELVSLRADHLADSDIVRILEAAIAQDPANPRNEIYSTVLKIVRSTNEEVGSTIPNCS